mmetsp:Transcript_57980/g.126748  ORF Transcript_57980/g.126748 Transcript_57980/m.126748 type:complete len:88 (-) Transcript_57980:18-281(-)
MEEDFDGRLARRQHQQRLRGGSAAGATGTWGFEGLRTSLGSLEDSLGSSFSKPGWVNFFRCSPSKHPKQKTWPDIWPPMALISSTDF